LTLKSTTRLTGTRTFMNERERREGKFQARL
jgi:hypothetical protein